MTRKILILVLSLLLLTDIGYTFLQNYYTPLDGDMASGIIPSEDVKPILASPLGIDILKDQEPYPNPNRFVSHWTFYQYFNHVPLFLQHFTTAIDSAYLSSAIAKTLIQVLIIFFLSILIAGNVRFEFLLAAFLITPLFQVNGYRSDIGIVDSSTTYSFFYALPIIFILVYFTPLFLRYYYKLELKAMKYLKYFWIPLALISSLSGPLNPGIALVISLLILVHFVFKNMDRTNDRNLFYKLILGVRNIPTDIYFYVIPISLFSLYSLFIGSYNSVNLNANNEVSLSSAYTLLAEGLYYSFTQKLAFPILFLILLINSLIIRTKIWIPEGKRTLNTFKWIGFFALIYILLLPLGGYRDYRPFVIRYDTIIPITLALMFIFAKMSIFILKHASTNLKYWYTPLIIIVLLIYTNADYPGFDKNECEKKAISQIADSKDSIIQIDADCNIISWEKIDDPKESILQIKLLRIWKIIDEDKPFYQKKQE